ncbi:MAG TPA: PadR family transcriptional regulator [Gaiellaceae bacterium]
MVPARRRRISTTEAAVLGLLRLGEFSGYDLSKMARGSVRYFWAPAQSQIYAILPRLVDDGFASRRHVRQERRPDKQLYRITEAGERALDDWLADPDAARAPVKNPFLLKLFLGEFMSREDVVTHVRRGRDAAAAELAELEQIAPNVDAHPYDGYVLEYGLEANRAFIRWADSVLAELEPAGAEARARR